MDTLKIKRGYVKSSMTRLLAFCDKINDETTIEALKTRLERLETIWKEFLQIQDDFAKFCNDPKFQDQSDENEEFEQNYLTTKQCLLRAINDKSASNSPEPNLIDRLAMQQTSFLEQFSSTLQTSAGSQNSNGSFHSLTKLPKLELPRFSGNYNEWISFKDLFSAAVDKNQNLSDSQKLNYLKSYVTGDAAALLRHVTLSDANYSSTWQRLKDRYDRKGQIVKSFIRTFLSLSPISSASVTGLRKLADGASEVIRGLEAIDHNATSRDPWLIYLLLQKTDIDTRQAWAEKTTDCEFPTIDMLISFLDKRGQAIEDSVGAIRPSSAKTSLKAHSIALEQCPRCNNSHQLIKCPDFHSMSIDDKRKFVNDKRLCFNCLRPGHTASSCPSKYTCRHCKGKHHSLVHLSRQASHQGVNQVVNSKPIHEANSTNSSKNVVHESISPVVSTSSHFSSNNAAVNSSILLPTALVHVQDIYGNMHPLRILLDSGSQVSFVSEHCVRRLGLRRKHSKIPVTGVSSCVAGITRGVVQLQLRSRVNDSIITIDAFILNKLTSDVPNCHFQHIPQLNTIQLADPDYNIPSPIDIILGSDKLFHILENDRFFIDNDRLVVQSTRFGWIVAGQHPKQKLIDNLPLEINTALLNSENDIDKLLHKFWEIEEVSEVCSQFSKEEEEAETIFSSTTVRAEDGRYVVDLPFKTPRVPLGKSYHTALKRLQSMEKRFETSEKLKTSYVNFLNEYLNLNHMEKVPLEEIKCDTCYYLPHHAVFKNDSSTTKLRVVFDGSAKSSSGFSLNDSLLTGPSIQRDLFSICIQFRTHRYVFTADLEKMYRQIWVSRKHADFQRILWRESSSCPVEIYRLRTVTYGTSPAPFLAIRVLRQLASDHLISHPIAAKIILENCYVDDILTGSSSVEDLLKARSELIHLLTGAGFHLRKWSSNCRSFLASLEENQCEYSAKDFLDDSKSVKTLGLKWIPSSDVFSFNISLTATDEVTKRSLLSTASRIFDPLGFLTPVTVGIKILFQSLWLLKLDWDDIVPHSVHSQWIKLYDNLPLLNSLNIPRFICDKSNSIELHGFSDASEKAFAAAVYCRINFNTSFQCQLVASKSKVAPLKQVSVARLELCGAVLLARLFRKVLKIINVRNLKIYAWTDSKIVLYWLSSPPRRWNTFVANRTAEILDTIPNATWSYVPSTDNPADCASRGISPAELIDSKIWWRGPHWLQEDITSWQFDRDISSQTPDCNTEERSNFIQALLIKFDNDILNHLCHKYSTWIRLLRVIAYCLRFIQNSSKFNGEKFTGALHVAELDKARLKCLLYVQATSFSTEIKCLQNNQFIKLRHQLSKLTPFLDDNGLMRVGGRLKNSELPFQTKHPIILPKHNFITTLIVRHFHFRFAHAGITELFVLLKQEYWILGSRNIIRKVVHNCTSCFRQRQQLSSQLMAQLPSSRVVYTRPFSYVGCDYAGPLTLRQSRGRHPKFTKGYICLFICLTSKAVHIELVTELTTDAFIAALRRFVARRGKCSKIFSDNGTNFKGAQRVLSELHQLLMDETHNTLVQDYLSQDGIQWVFNPPSAPHFGGLWESMIKSIKTHLKRVIGDHVLTFEEMYTILTQIEAVINSRPLCYIPDSEFEALTPFHLLTGTSYTSIPEPDLISTRVNHLSNWRLLQHMLQGFWKRWHSEYLTSLQQRPKWQQIQKNINCGDVVLVKEPNLPPSKWILGKIEAVHPDKSGHVRVATVYTNSGTFVRPIVKLAKLPLQED